MKCPFCKSPAPKKHCESVTCSWHVCVHCELVFDFEGRSMVWRGSAKK